MLKRGTALISEQALWIVKFSSLTADITTKIVIFTANVKNMHRLGCFKGSSKQRRLESKTASRISYYSTTAGENILNL